MDIKHYTKEELEKLQKLNLGNKLHVESELYLDNDKIFKSFYMNNTDEFKNKIETVTSLVNNKDNINIEEIVFPEQLVEVSNEIKGFNMPYIRSIPFNIYLGMKNKTIKDKIDFLKQINDILLKMKKVREEQNNNFYVNDFHEDNILFNIKTQKVNFVDIDSCRIYNNEPFASKYLTSTSIASTLDKYKVNDSNSSGYIIPDQNSDIYCYATIVLNYLYQDKFYKLNRETIEKYFEYLRTIGFTNEFVEKFSIPFMETKDNEFLGDYLEELTEEKLEKANQKVFSKI